MHESRHLREKKTAARSLFTTWSLEHGDGLSAFLLEFRFSGYVPIKSN